MKTLKTVSARFERNGETARWTGPEGSAQGWRSHGGPTARHPDRARPSVLRVDVPEFDGRLSRFTLIGVFALHSSADVEPTGSVGAAVHLVEDGETVHTWELVQGRHYTDAAMTNEVFRLNGDGTSVETTGRVIVDGRPTRVDMLSFDVPGGMEANTVLFRDLGTPASFLLFDAQFDFEESGVCPFRGHDGQVALAEIGGILRLRDRSQLDKALYQMSRGIHACGHDLDEARGLALTFLAAVVAALLEIEPQRSMHKEQLEAARELDRLQDPVTIASIAVRRVRALTDSLVKRSTRTGDALIDRALDLVDRNFASQLDADSLARELNLSTSHFRHLFREATRQPFNRFLVSVRLEKARELLLQSEIPVNEVADTVGFQSPAHFSRAFSKRFGVAPSALRQVRR